MTLFTHALVLLNFVHLLYAQDSYSVPTPEIVATSKGFRVSIPDEPGIQVFFFHGSVNKQKQFLDPDTIVISTRTPTKAKWVLESDDNVLQVGDIIYYWVYVKKNDVGYTKPYSRYVITEIKGSSATTCEDDYTSESSECPGMTISVAKGQVMAKNEVLRNEEVWYWT